MNKVNTTIKTLSAKDVVQVSGGIVPVVIGGAVVIGALLWPSPAHSKR